MDAPPGPPGVSKDAPSSTKQAQGDLGIGVLGFFHLTLPSIPEFCKLLKWGHVKFQRLGQVQQVYKPVDLLKITFCTRRLFYFVGVVPLKLFQPRGLKY